MVKSTSALWNQFDKVFAEADKLWAEADRLMRDAPEHEITPDAHHVRFKAKTFWGRIRLAGHFTRLALRVLFKGQITLTFKRAKSHVQNN